MMTHRKTEFLSDDGTIIRETIEEIDILDGLKELAEDKIQLMKEKTRMENRIAELQEAHANRAQVVTERYNAVIKQLQPAVVDAIRENYIGLNNLLAKAFPSDFEIVTPTIVADEGKRADGKPIVKE